MLASSIASAQYSSEFSRLRWSDEFDNSGLPDKSNWGYETGYVRNRERQYYVEKSLDNSRCQGGFLIIEARKETDGKITSASLTSAGKRQFFYGRIEIRAKLPNGTGVWSSAWMQGVAGKWPRCGQIDLIDFVGFEPNRVFTNVHTYGSVRLPSNKKSPIVNAWSAQCGTLSTDFHVYAIEWHPDRLKFFLDEKLVAEYAKDSGYPDFWAFDKPTYLVLSLAIGGTFGGQRGIDELIFPAKYYIDYVRYYTR